MSYPAEFVRYLDSLPFLGRTTISHTEVVAGETIEMVVTYEVGAAGLADGAWLKLVFKFYSDWGLFQTSNPQAANYVSAEYAPRPTFSGESPATVRSLKVRFDQKGHERPYQKAVIIDVVDGYLKPGDKIILRLGDRHHGGPGTRVQTFVEEAFRFRVFIDTVGASRFAPVPGDLVLRIVPGAAERDVLLCSRLARPGVPLAVTYRQDDQWGNLAPASEGAPDLIVSDVKTGREVERIRLQWTDTTAWSRAQLNLSQPGDYSLRAGNAQAWLTIDSATPTPRALFADLHIHSEDTVGVNTTTKVMTFARDAAALDIAGYTANDFNVRADRWDAAVAVCRQLHAERAFLCFPGTEWCGASAVGGDRNVVFLGEEVRFPLDKSGRSLRVFDWNEDTPKTKDLQGDVATAAGLHAAYRDMAEDDQVLLIPHVGGRRAIFDWHEPSLERLVEIASSWGHFDWFYRQALARGLQVGASAAGDEHRGRPGGGAPGVGSFGVTGGLTGVLSDELTSRSVARALRARHTWATTGARSVALLNSGTHRQGDAFDHQGPLEVNYRVLGNEGWEQVELRDETGKALLTRSLDRELGYAPNRLRIRWGGARIPDRYRWAEWRGVIEIAGASVKRFVARGLEYPEEQVKQVAPGRFEVRSDTYGDADHVEVELDDLAAARISLRFEIGAYNKTGDVLAPNPDPVTPGCAWEFTGAELASGDGIVRQLGGAELFVAAERVSAFPLPRSVEGSFTVPAGNGAHGHRAIYLFARERDDAKVWTSPLFVTFRSPS